MIKKCLGALWIPLPLVLMANRILLIAKLWRTGINSLIFILRSFFEYVPTYQRGLIQQNQALKLTRLQRNYVEIGDLFLRKSGSSAACFFSVSCMAQLAVKDFGGIFHQSNCKLRSGPMDHEAEKEVHLCFRLWPACKFTLFWNRPEPHWTQSNR